MKQQLNKNLSSEEFLKYYYLKDELILFCREVGIYPYGSKQQLKDRIVKFLDTGEIDNNIEKKKNNNLKDIELSLDKVIEDDFICTQNHRMFFQKYIGRSFRFYVEFQNWLKNNSGKTYEEAIVAYYGILNKKKNVKSKIDVQFEYNQYIRDFFEDNKGLTLKEAIVCWKYKKSLPGNNIYDKEDLIVLERR